MRAGGRRGITLIETMVAITVLLIMSAIVFETMHNAIEFHNLLSMRDETIRTARAAMSKLGRDFQLAYLSPNRSIPNQYQTVFVGTDTDPSQVIFTSLNHQRMYLDSRECDQTEISVWGEEADSEQGKGYVLFHREAPRIDELPDEDGRIWPLAYNVRAFHLRYLDSVSNTWRTSWDTRDAETMYRYPRAVEIGLVLIAPDPDDPESTVDVPFLETVLVEYAERIVNPNQVQLTPPKTGQGGYSGAGWGGLTSGFTGMPGLGGSTGGNAGAGGNSGSGMGNPGGGMGNPGGGRPGSGGPGGGGPGGRPGGGGFGGPKGPPGGMRN